MADLSKNAAANDIAYMENIHLHDGERQRLSIGVDDDERLAQLGHVQELRREFSITSLGGLCLCLMATWEALSTVVATALISGGPACLFYN
jgi:hypothetical protein